MTGLLLGFVVLTALAAVSSATLALLAWQRRQVPGALFFSAMMLAAAVWCACYAGELSSASLVAKTFWARLAYLGIATVPPSWLLFSLFYTGKLSRRTTATVVALYLLPLATVVFAMLSPAVPLVWSSERIVTSEGAHVLMVAYGPWFWVHTAYSYACLAIGSALLLVSILRQVRTLTSQGSTIVAAVSLPWLMNALTIFHLIPAGSFAPLGILDLTPPTIAASGILIAVGLWRLQMFDVFPALVPAARDAVITELQDGVLVVDGHGRVLSANRAAGELLSRSDESVVGASLPTLVGKTSPACEALADLWAVDKQRLEMSVANGKDEPRHVELAISSYGRPRHGDGHVLVMRDISERVATTQALRESSQRLRVLFDQSPVGVMVFDRDLIVTECNERFAAMVRMGKDDLIGHDLTSADDSSLLPLFRAALSGETLNYNGPYTLSPSGAEVWLQGEVSPLRDDAGETTGGIAVLWDMTDSKRAEELIERLAFRDTVTELPNRTLFRDRLRQVLAQTARSTSSPIVALVNLDRFTAVNESIGHAAADRLLKAVGERLSSRARGEDTVGRWGGDEFAVLLPALAGSDDGFAVARRLSACFAEPWHIDEDELWLTASIGLAVYPSDGDAAQALLAAAETAMHAAKKLGGGGYQFYTPSMNGRSDDQVALTSAMHRALEEHEFVVYYQPQVDLATMCTIGCEALVRWNHPERGLVAPDLFVPLAERTGLMQPIGEWVLRDACAQGAAWERTYHSGIRVAVNLSARQLGQHGLAEMVADALSQTGLPPRLLELEVTETAIMADPEGAARTLAEIASMGVSVALDDFGTGYSSLTRLRQLPIDRLKIDRSFVRDLPEDPDDCAIAVAVIDLARNLDLQVIAEGVETWQQVSFLRAKGCHEVQGYLFGKPEPAAKFTLVPAADMVDSSAPRPKASPRG